MSFWELPEYESLSQEVARVSKVHLRDLLKDEARDKLLNTVHDSIHLDATRQHVDKATWEKLVKLYEAAKVPQKIQAMFSGEKINMTEDRSVLHVALRAHKGDLKCPGLDDPVPPVLEVQQRMAKFSNAVRNKTLLGHTGKALTNVICIGIGGSYLGVEFVFEALRTYKPAAKAAQGRTLRFLANVDPIDVARALEGSDPETTLAVVVSKTFTTAETMMNARTIKNWFLESFNNDQSCINKHVCAVSTNLKATGDFGILADNVFGFWDWVGGRFSVCSAVGVLPLCLQYGFDMVQEFLDGARDIDLHFKNEKTPCKNIPVMMGLISFLNSTLLDRNCVAVLPYCQALLRFPAHIQQLTMESNGKRVTLHGHQIPHLTSGEIYFGEPGTNGQHSFYQLIHQGRVVPCEFIGLTKSQNHMVLDNEFVSNHDELMSNFFAQPDALALGRTCEQLKEANTPPNLIPHKEFPGNRPSMSLLFEGELTPRRVGQLLAIYEHRTAVEGFLWNVNSFDQWGVELGKVLAKDIRNIIGGHQAGQSVDQAVKALVPSSRSLLNVYLKNRN